MARGYHFTEYWQFVRHYNKCMDCLTKIWCRWYGSALGVTHSDVQNLYDLTVNGVTTLTKFTHEMNDKIFYDMYGEHLYKDCQGKDVESYKLVYKS